MTMLPALPFSVLDPEQFLNALFELDEAAAVRKANDWGGNPGSCTSAQYLAAWNLVCRQTIFPVCISCRWPVVDGDPHHPCEAELSVQPDEDDDTDGGDDYDRYYGEDQYDPRDEEDMCDGICGQPVNLCTCAETEAYRRHQADPNTCGSWFVA